jgi:hypothetical protein
MTQLVEQTAALLSELHARDRRSAVEPVRPAGRLSLVNMATDAAEIVGQVGDPSFGYVFDTYHLTCIASSVAVMTFGNRGPST